MKKLQQYLRPVVTLLICLALTLFFVPELSAQNKKERVRLNADYVKITGKEHYLNIKASARIDRQTVAVDGIDLSVFQVIDDVESELGTTKTNTLGISKFVIKDFSSLQPDSTGVYNLIVVFDGNDTFKKASREVTFRDATIVANWIEKDSMNFVSAKITDSALDSALAEVNLRVQVERLFRPLRLGKDFYSTDDDGEIEVQIEDGIPGIDGKLNLEVVLNDSDAYGTVKTVIEAPVGIPIVEESTFDQRTMWSPRGKTPIVLLALTFSFIIVVWGIFLYLVTNLFKIVKS